MTVADRTWALLTQALEVYQENPRAVGWLQTQCARFAEPLRIAVAGTEGSGKSTLVTALVGAPVTSPIVSWPSRGLGDLILVDEPSQDADAVLFLLRHPADTVPMDGGMHTIAVLSHADELGGGRVDALISARQIARRRRREPEIGEVCDLIAVAGLAAAAGRMVDEAQFDAFALLAGCSREDLEPWLLSADRFVRPECPAPVQPEVRAELVHRFGLFGVRLAITLLRQGCDTAPKLSAQFQQRSGLTELRDAIGQCFTEHAPVLKARTALLALEALLRRELQPGAGALGVELDRVLAGAHEFRALRALSSLRTGRTILTPELADEARLLLSGAQVTLDALPRWKEIAEDSLLSSTDRATARVVVRTCEEALVSGMAG
ncbi:hypothetical protein [Amycolatopsis sp. NPDC059657]|uniref:hypothetical protein n=1 Tax=Amycolatopsis sp. NPDC059657 TaxID=3346899 RepID=UPI00366BBAFB